MHSEAASLAPRRSLAPDLSLIAITVIWGGTLIVVKTALQWSGAFTFVALRFGLAALLLAMANPRAWRSFSAAELRGGVLIGVAIFCGYSLQTIGLREISSSASAFYTALYVAMVPILQILLFRRMPSGAAWVGIVLACVGMLLLSRPQTQALQFSTGAVLTMVGALAMAFEILLISRYAIQGDPRRLALLQFVTVSVLACAALLLSGEAAPQLTVGYLACVAAMGLASAFIQRVITWAQKTVPATRAAVIYSLESVWSALVGVWVGDRLGPLGFCGGALIVLSILVAELRLAPRRRAPRTRV